MKIGLMTWYCYYNYGTYLQAAALLNWLQSKHHDVELIQYDPRNAESYENDIKRKSILDIWYRTIRKINYFRGNYNQVSEFSGYVFDEFAKFYFKFSKPCRTMNELQSLNNEYDAFICGSDQIWSPLAFDPHYYLDFADDKKKIAYAPSMGVSSIENFAIQMKIKELLESIPYLSIREEEGQKIIKDLINREVINAVDPTMLLNCDEWSKFFRLKNNGKGKYILVYFLGDNQKYWKVVDEISQAMQLPCKIIPVYPKDKKRNGVMKTAIGPIEFVELVKNASYVCTDSFHGMVFSIIFDKNFLVFKRFKENDRENQNSRIFSAIKKLQIRDRMYNGGKVNQYLDNIDYLKVNQRLDVWKAESSDYLMKALGEVEMGISGGFDNL